MLLVFVSVLLLHSALFTNGGSNEVALGETIGPFAAKLGERGPQGLGGVEASSENKGQSPGVIRQGQDNAEGWSGPGKGFWGELWRAFVRLPCARHEIRAVCFQVGSSVYPKPGDSISSLGYFEDLCFDVLQSFQVKSVIGGQRIICLLNFHVYIAFALK